MTAVLSRKLTKKDSREEVVAAILKLATDKNKRLLLDDECGWLEAKIREIARLVRILKTKL